MKRFLNALFAGVLFGVLLYIVLPFFGLPSNFVQLMSGSMALVGFVVFLFPPKETEKIVENKDED